MSRNPLFCSLASFSIVSPTPFINKPVSSKDLIIFMISFISSFEIVSVVMSGPKIFFEYLYLLLMLLLLILIVLALPTLCISESCIEIKFNLNFYFHTSLWCFKKAFIKPFEEPKTTVKIKI